VADRSRQIRTEAVHATQNPAGATGATWLNRSPTSAWPPVWPKVVLGNIPLVLVFVCCWAGIPLWLTLTRWSAELVAKHAEVTPEAAVALVVAQPVPVSAAARETGRPVYAGVAEPLGR
jgi:hypothetical protein